MKEYLERWCGFIFRFLIAAFVLVPSSILLPVKLLVILLSAGSYLIWSVSASAKFSYRDLFILLVFPLWLVLSAIYALKTQSYSGDIVLRALVSYLSIFILFFVCAIYLRYALVSVSEVKKAFCVCLLLYCLIKLFIMFIPLVLGIGVKEASLIFSAGFLVEYRSEDQGFLRLATSNDLMLPFGLVFLIFDGVFNSRVMRYCSVLIFLVTSVLTFTRFVWLASLAPFLLFIGMANIRKKVEAGTLAALIIPIIIYLVSMFEYGMAEVGVFSELFVRAFDSASLGVKEVQAARLYEMFSESPILGYGIGSYDKGYIRSGDLPFIYETQWISFLVQGGIVGVCLLLSYLLYPLFKVFTQCNGFISKERVAFSCVYILFLLSGFTNPNISALSAAIIYFLAYACLLDGNRRSNNGCFRST